MLLGSPGGKGSGRFVNLGNEGRAEFDGIVWLEKGQFMKPVPRECKVLGGNSESGRATVGPLLADCDHGQCHLA